MTSTLWWVAAGVGAALLGMGVYLGWIWRDASHEPDKWHRRASISMGVFFAIVALVVALDMISLTQSHRKVVECDSLLLNALEQSSIAQQRVNDAAINFDRQLLATTATLREGALPANDAVWNNLDDALNGLIVARHQRTEIERNNPLPNC